MRNLIEVGNELCFPMQRSLDGCYKNQPTWKLCCQIALQAFFDADKLIVETTRYFYDHDHPVDPFADDNPTGVPPRLVQDLGFYLVRASRTWDRTLSFSSELFRRTVRTAAAQPSAAVLSERDRLRQPMQPIEEDDHLRPLIRSVNAELSRFLPQAPMIKLRVTNTDSRAVLDAVAAHFGPHGGLGIPATRQGSGLLSLQGLPHIKAGRLRALAVSTAKRSALFPELPTISESGLPGFEVLQWSGLMGPAGTPRAVVGKYQREIAMALNLPDVRQKLASQGFEAVGNTPGEFSDYIRAEIIKWAKVIQEAGIRPD